MAKNLLPKLISCLRTFIQTEEFKSLAREADTDFTRDRKLKLKDYIYMIINRPSTSLTDMIRKYTDEMKDTPVCSKQAFSKGRKRIRPESIRGLISRAAEFIQRNSSGLKTWNGLQVFAVDGSRINLPDSKESRRYFGIQKGSGEQVQGLLSGLYDVLNGFFVDAEMAPCASNERKLVLGHIARYRAGYADFLHKSVITFDRGYPSGELIEELGQEGPQHLNYVMRCCSEFTRNMCLTGDDCILTYKFIKASRPVKLRVIRFKLYDGSTEILVTNLLESRYTVNDFRELYHLRWGIETVYNLLKNRIELENYSGSVTRAILQDTYGAIVLVNIFSAFQIDLRSNHPLSKDKIPNRAETLRLLRTRLFRLFQHRIKLVPFYSSLLLEAANYYVYVKPGRFFPRIIRHKMARFSMNNRRS